AASRTRGPTQRREEANGFEESTDDGKAGPRAGGEGTPRSQAGEEGGGGGLARRRRKRTLGRKRRGGPARHRHSRVAAGLVELMSTQGADASAQADHLRLVPPPGDCAPVLRLAVGDVVVYASHGIACVEARQAG